MESELASRCVQQVKEFLELPESDRAPARLGKAKLHGVWRLTHAPVPLVIKVRGRETARVRISNLYKGLRHLLLTGEVTRLWRARVERRWENELYCTEGWKALGLPTVSLIPFPDPAVRVMRDMGLPTLAEFLRDPEQDLSTRLAALQDVARLMHDRHARITASSKPLLFHEEPHTGNIFYAPGKLVFFDQEFLPDPARPLMHHAGAEFVALIQSAVRDIGHENAQGVAEAIAAGYGERCTLDAAARLLRQRSSRWRWLRRSRSPVSGADLAGHLERAIQARFGDAATHPA